jgi:hypothetical protein
MLTPTQLALYGEVIGRALDSKMPFAVGGSLSMALYAGAIRPSRDLDLYVTPRTKDRMIDLLINMGFADFYDQRPYDRSWIFRSAFGDDIVDVIWGMANHRTEVDTAWIQRGPVVDFEGRSLRLIPVEELIWSKLYVLQKDRCDWPDILNLIGHCGASVDWPRLRDRLGDDIPLLDAVLSVYAWLRPERDTDAGPAETPAQTRARLIDSREWLTFK